MTDAAYPGNSNNKKDAEAKKAERPKIEKVIEGEVERRKKPVGARMKDAMFGDAAKGVLAFVATTVIVPMLKDLVSNGTQALVDGIVYGEDGRNRGVGSRNKSHTNYNRMSSGRDRSYIPDSKRELSERARTVHDFEDLVLNSRNEGQLVLERLSDLVQEYGHATVAELYDALGVTGSFTDSKWGWYDLRGARVRPGRGGYVLDMPRTEPIE